jgi:hypothetical protein
MGGQTDRYVDWQTKGGKTNKQKFLLKTSFIIGNQQTAIPRLSTKKQSKIIHL